VWLRSWLRRLPSSARTISSSDGSFRIESVRSNSEEAFVVAQKSGYAMAWLASDWLSRRAEVAAGLVTLKLLRASGRVAGRVIREDGSPPDGPTRVEASSEPVKPGDSSWSRTVTAEADGSFLIEGLPNTLQSVQVRTPEGRAEFTTVGTLDLRIVLFEPFTFGVSVLDEGRAMDRYELAVGRRPEQTAIGDVEWEHRSVDLSRTQPLRLWTSPSQSVLVQAFAGELCSAPRWVTFPPHDTSDTLRLDLWPGRVVSGTVIDRQSRGPIAGAEVSVWRGTDEPSLARACALTAHDGQFALGPLPASASRLDVVAPGYAETRQSVVQLPRDSCVIELERRSLVQFRPGPALLALIRRAEVRPYMRVLSAEGRDAHIPVDLTPLGLFLDDLAPGTYRAHVAGAIPEMPDRTFTVAPGELVVVDL
jgi:hypothetical protein